MRFKIFILLSVITLGMTQVVCAENVLPSELAMLDSDIRQVILVTVDKSSDVNASISLWRKSSEDSKEVWSQFNSEPIPAVVGRNGLAPAGQKREGDGRTPTGKYEIYRSFGYDEVIKTGLEYRQATALDFWIDDPKSVWYNQWVSGRIPSVSYEKLRREDDLYKYAIIIEYNTDPVISGNGSAIFMHVWKGAGQSTAGCVAMAEMDMVKLLNWLKLDHHPVVIIRSSEVKSK
ncbi:MAG: L,D-transpeptidase family protein [Candidatus Omnitrophica bacterium]|nr:L,D-transpeptidase family protein [Candidatus Omnitrophota bacterium]